MSKTVLDKFVSRHDYLCEHGTRKSLYSSPGKCNCGRDEAAEELAALQSANRTQAERIRKLEAEKINKYYDGTKDGVFLYAWWADGGLQVGTNGKTFTEACLEIEKDRNEALSRSALAEESK